MDPVPNQTPSIPSPVRRRPPEIPIALVVATVASGACVYMGHVTGMEGGCDGGLCAIPKLLGWVAAFVAWPIVFGVTWSLVRLSNRRD